jgi:hypothetical protein
LKDGVKEEKTVISSVGFMMKLPEKKNLKDPKNSVVNKLGPSL